MSQKPPRVLLIVTGGVAAYKAGDVVRELRRRGATVRVAMSPAATEFVTPMTFEALSGERVWTDLLPGCTDGQIDHIELGRWAQVVAVVPATADFLARLQAGMANDLPLALLLALPKSVPVLLAPAMNREMWSHPATQRNLEVLRSWREVQYHVLEPVDKELACGEFGPGGLPEPGHIAARVEALVASFREAAQD